VDAAVSRSDAPEGLFGEATLFLLWYVLRVCRKVEDNTAACGKPPAE
jgi:hypothetical protein